MVEDRDQQSQTVPLMMAAISGGTAFVLSLLLDFGLTFAVVVGIGAFIVSLLITRYQTRRSRR